MGITFAMLKVIDFTLLVSWHIVFVSIVFLSWSLNSMVTMTLGFCGTLRIYQEACALFWGNSVIAWSVIQDEKGGPTPGLALLSYLSWSIFSGILHWLWKITGRWVRRTMWTSRNGKSSTFFSLWCSPVIFLTLYSWEVWASLSPCFRW